MEKQTLHRKHIAYLALSKSKANARRSPSDGERATVAH